MLTYIKRNPQISFLFLIVFYVTFLNVDIFFGNKTIFNNTKTTNSAENKVVDWMSYSDQIQQFLPNQNFLKKSLEMKVIPFWNPLSVTGYPFSANAHNLVYDPINPIFILGKSVEKGHSIRMMIYIGATAILFFILLLQFKISATIALIVSFNLLNLQFYVFDDYYLVWFYTIPWVLIGIILTNIFFEQRRYRYLFLIAFSNMFLFLSGELQTAYNYFILIFSFVIFKIYDQDRKLNTKLKIEVFIFFSLFIFAGLGLAIFQILETKELLNQSFRSISEFNPRDLGIKFNEFSELWLSRKINLVLFLFLPFLFFNINKLKIFLLVSFVFFADVSLYGPICRILSMILPIFKSFNSNTITLHFPLSFILWTLFALSIDNFFQLIKSKVPTKLYHRGSYLFIVIFITLDCLPVILNYKNFLYDENVYLKEQCIEVIKNKTEARTLKLLDDILSSNIPMYFGISDFHFYDSFFLKTHVNLFHALDDSIFDKEQSDSNFIQKFSNQNLLNSDFTKIISSNYLITKRPIELSQWKKIYSSNNEKCYYREPGVNIYQSKTFNPLVRWGNQVSYIQNEENIINEFKSGNFKDFIFLPELKKSTKTLNQNSGKISYSRKNPNNISIEVDASTNGPLIINESFYPGWKATIDGNQVEILRTNYAFMGIIVPPGKHLIEFNFLPSTLYFGLIISCLSLILLILVFLYIKIYRPNDF